MSNWITDRQPDKNGEYLVTLNGYNFKYVHIYSWANDLYAIDDFDFARYRYKKKTERAGWYYYDDEYGYHEVDGILAWQELPEPYKGEEE